MIKIMGTRRIAIGLGNVHVRHEALEKAAHAELLHARPHHRAKRDAGQAQ